VLASSIKKSVPMDSPAPAPRCIRFGVFEIDLQAGEVRKSGVKLKLQEQPFQVLLTLLDKPGEVVTREELRQRLWSTDTFVDVEHSMGTAINKIREALGDSAENPRFIETLPRRGYRFIAPLDGPSPDTRSVATSGGPDDSPASASPAPRGTPWRRVAAGAAVAIAVAVLAWGIWRYRVRVGDPPIRSLAVLPLVNLSNDPQQEYFVEGMTDELITTLAKISGLRVISRTSVVRYRNAHEPVTAIGRELGVDAIIEGTVLRSDGKIRITAQLIHAATDRHLWAESYERDLRDVFALQAEVARAIALKVRVKLSPLSGSSKASALSPEAYELYLRGRYARDEGGEGLKLAFGYFQQALDIDPDYALAYAGLADSYALLPFYSQTPPREAFPKARAAALNALRLDENLAEAHASMAYVKTYYDWDWVGAEQEFKRTLELNPNHAAVHHNYSRFLASLGRVAEARVELKRAQELDPLSLLVQANAGVISYFGRQYDEAIQELRKTSELDPHFSVPYWGLAMCYEQQGKYEEAIAQFQKAIEASGRGSNSIASLGHAFGLAGRRNDAQKILLELRDKSKKGYVSSYQVALVELGLGHKDQAMGALEAAFQERSTLLTYLKMDPRFDPLRSDPRFQQFVRRIGFPA
jgi:TolB-like protein/DNA-binding winged helix-turn-helix (wHTH) protein/Flp pilus assembly protein TadD